MDEVSNAALGLIRRFVERQGLVDRFLSAVRPDFYIALNDDTDLDTFFESMRKYSDFPQIGVWGENGEWDYFIHGRGCMMRHKVTREPIEWDTPDLRAFDRYWLANYLDWIASREIVESEFVVLASAYRQSGLTAFEFLRPLHEALKSQGCLEESDQNRLRLTDKCG